MVCVSCPRDHGYKKDKYMEKKHGSRKVARTPQLWRKMYKWEKKQGKNVKKMDPEIKKIIRGKKIVVLVSWSGHSDYIYI